MLLLKHCLVLPLSLALLAGGALAGDKKDKDEPDQPVNEKLQLKACGPSEKEVHYSTDTDKSQHPTPQAPADKALIFVVRPTMTGNKIQTKLAVDGEWKGVNRGNNYFFFNLEPGEHYLCSRAENHSVKTVKVEAGKTYFLQQHIRMGVMKARNSLEVITPEEGQKAVEKCHLSTWTVK
jgi:Protein of unknown function (DUF2846)